METKLWMGEVEKCNTYYTMYHKRRVETTWNAFCGKITGSELYNTPSFGQSTTCNEAIASTGSKKKCEGAKLKNLTKKCVTYYTMYHKRRWNPPEMHSVAKSQGASSITHPLLEKAQRALKLLGFGSIVPHGKLPVQ